MSSSPNPKRTITTRRHHSPELWAQARRDYLAGFTASAVSKHYGMSVDAIRKRASKEKWCKARNRTLSPIGGQGEGGARALGLANTDHVTRRVCLKILRSTLTQTLSPHGGEGF